MTQAIESKVGNDVRGWMGRGLQQLLLKLEVQEVAERVKKASR